jgi:hypothetical protein
MVGVFSELTLGKLTFWRLTISPSICCVRAFGNFIFTCYDKLGSSVK